MIPKPLGPVAAWVQPKFWGLAVQRQTLNCPKPGFELSPFSLTPAPMQHIIRGLEAVEAIPGRCEIIDEGQEFGVVVDAASDPRALSTLLDSCRQCISDTRTSRIFLVLGCQGDVETAWQRPYLGEIAHYKVCKTLAMSCLSGWLAGCLGG